MKKINIALFLLFIDLFRYISANETILLENITITATQDPTLKVTEAPLLVDILSKDEIKEKAITKTEELFRQTSGVDVKTAGGSVMPIIRGLSDEQILILVDGVRLSDERPGGNHILSIDPAQIERIEIVKGASSVLYGAGAIGGVINIITKKGGENKTSIVSGNIATGYESNNQAKKLEGEINLNIKDFNFYIGAINRDFNNQKSPKEKIKFSFYDGYTIWGGGNYLFENLNIAFNIWQNRANIGITAPRSFIFDYFKNETHTKADTKILYQSKNGILRGFELIASWQEHLRHRIREPNKERLVDIKVNKKTTTLRGQWNLQINKKSRVVTGFDLFDENLVSSRVIKGFSPVIAQFNNVPVIAPSSRDGIGIFLQDEFTYSDRLKFITGIRYDLIKTKSDGAEPPFFITTAKSDIDKALSGSFGVVYKIDQTTNIYANMGRAFRAPTLIERYFFGPHDGPAQDRGNPDLDPETSFNLDIGFRIDSKKNKFLFSLYHNRINNLIQKILINPNAPVEEQIYQYQNISKGIIYGAELDMRYFIDDNWSLLFSSTITKGEDISKNQPLAHIPPLKINYGINYMNETDDLYYNITLLANSTIRQNKISSQEKETPGYTVVDFKIYLAKDSGFEASFAVTNIFNKNYYDHLSYAWQALGYSAMGRNIKFEVGYNF